ncbi:hypothetical protein [Rothia nasisuis]|uniref:hypothetical protein n=1 Tax=Rothia nasisuis TaxID=2109647 RepID=UPI001F2A4587|nr:hypothetical protein [Rothia nasisuis]
MSTSFRPQMTKETGANHLSEAKMQRPQGTESAARRAPIAWISKDFSCSEKEKENLAHLASVPARSEPGERVRLTPIEARRFTSSHAQMESAASERARKERLTRK